MTLKGKKCPRAGITVATKGGLVGVTVGTCGPRAAPHVTVPGLGTGLFKKSELTALPKRKVAKLEADMARITKRRSNYDSTGPARPAYIEHNVDHLPMDGLGEGYGGLGIGDTVMHPFLGTATVLRLFTKYDIEYADIRRTRDGEVHKGIPVDNLEPV